MKHVRLARLRLATLRELDRLEWETRATNPWAWQVKCAGGKDGSAIYIADISHAVWPRVVELLFRHDVNPEQQELQ